ncbi:MAG: hypothetical protein IIZ97_07100 [Prevotella sp.]|nr:hypothetical protein [Prevotella sp.]
MKETYMSPNICIINVSTRQMIAASVLQQNGDNAEVDVTTTDDGYGGTFGSRRGYSVWDEDEDDEDEEDYM